MNKLVSIIVLVRNYQESLIKTLESIKKSNYKNIEVLLLFKNPSDCWNAAKKIEHGYLVWIIPNESEPEMLNRAMRVINGDYVMFLNESCVLYQDGIKNLAARFRYGILGVIGKAEIPGHNVFYPSKPPNFNNLNSICEKPISVPGAKLYKNDSIEFDPELKNTCHWKLDISKSRYLAFIDRNICIDSSFYEAINNEEKDLIRKEFSVTPNVVKTVRNETTLKSAINPSTANEFKIAVYSCITTDLHGKKDDFFMRSKPIEGIDYYLFTEDPEKFQSDHIKILQIPKDDHDDKIKKKCEEVEPDLVKRQKLELIMRSQKVRILAPTYPVLQDYDFCIWIDGRIALIKDPTEYINEQFDKEYLFYLIHHPGKDIFEELDEYDRQDKCSRIGCENTRKFYKKLDFPRDFGLWWGGIQIYYTKDKNIFHYLRLYWNTIVKITTVDQLAIPYMIKNHGMPVKTIARQCDSFHNTHFQEGQHKWY